MPEGKSTILVIDDEMMSLKVAERILSGKYRVLTALSGQEGIDIAYKEKPDLILVDLRMPQMDGFEVLSTFQKLGGEKKVPIIVMTSEEGVDSEVRGLEMGATDYIRKPVIPEILLKRIETALVRAEQMYSLEDRAETDLLTGVWNRGVARARLDGYLAAERVSAALMMTDLDNFKYVNDNYGHQMGDNVITTQAAVMKENVKEDGFVGRIGGDEFVVCILGETDKEKLRRRAEKIIEDVTNRINALLETVDQPLVSMSIGIAIAPEDGTDFESLYTSADRALYFAKQNGKRCCHFYQDGVNGVLGGSAGDGADGIEFLRSIVRLEDVPVTTGAYSMEFKEFKHFLAVLERNVGRTGEGRTFVMFHLDGKRPDEQDDEADISGRLAFGKIAKQMLRRGDVGSYYGQDRFMLLLLHCDLKSAEHVVERIMNKWHQVPDCDTLNVTYEMRSIK